MKNCLVIFSCYLGVLFSELSLNQIESANVVHSQLRNRVHYASPTRRINVLNVCPAINIKNGVAKRRNPRAKIVRYMCNRNYLLAGEKHSTCFRNKWDPPPPRCVRPTCKPIGSQINGNNLLVYPTHSSAVRHFYCKAGYYINGPTVIYCDGTSWSDHVPMCLAINTKPKLSCDFETEDLCGWTHDLNHDFDWARENYNTPSGSIGTGPSFDHTKGRGEGGFYMYIESSSRAENDTARLISPVYGKMDGDVCFEFFYHMYGATIGSLRVYLKMVNESWSLNPQKAFFSLSGNRGDRWYKSFVHLGTVPDEFQIIIEGIRGVGYVSDIAVDDVKVIQNCKDEVENTTTMESSTYNGLIPTVESCENRCGQIDTTTVDSYHITCDCDDDCFNNNRCCPDYFDTCLGSTISDEFDTTMASEEMLVTEQNTTSTDRTLAGLKTKLNEITSTTVKIKIKTEVPTTIATTSTKINPLQHPPTQSPATTRIFLERSTRPPTKMTTKIMQNRPIIHLQTPSPTPVIYRKILTTPKPFIFTVSTIKSDKNIDSTDDGLEVPRPTKIDEGISEDVAKEFWPDEIENSVDSPFLRNFSESNKLFSQTYIESANSNFLVLGISLTAVFILVSVVAFIVVRRYRFSRILMSSNGESQSDVRYLTSEDALNFSLADCYDDDQN